MTGASDRTIKARQTIGLVTLVVRDYDQAIDFYVGSLGFTLVEVREPSVESYGTVAVFRDLYGNRWDLLQPNAEAIGDPAIRIAFVRDGIE